MASILPYVKNVIASGNDGTICVLAEADRIGILTIVNQRIVSASFEDKKGKEAFEAIKHSQNTSAVFWTDVTRQEDIQRMIRALKSKKTSGNSANNTNEIAPKNNQTQSKTDDNASGGLGLFSLSKHDIKALKTVLANYLGPVSGFIVDDAIAKSSSTKQLIQLLSKELIDQSDVAPFMQEAYSSLSLK